MGSLPMLAESIFSMDSLTMLQELHELFKEPVTKRITGSCIRLSVPFSSVTATIICILVYFKASSGVHKLIFRRLFILDFGDALFIFYTQAGLTAVSNICLNPTASHESTKIRCPTWLCRPSAWCVRWLTHVAPASDLKVAQMKMSAFIHSSN